jgi:nucleotide-binding universal stress UspA family protein
MSIFPTKILLATDGSSEAQLTARTAVDVAQKTDSELDVIHVVDIAPSIALLYPEATDPEWVESVALLYPEGTDPKRVESIALLYPEATDPERVKQLAPVLKEALERHSEKQGRELLDGEVERVRSDGETVAQSHLMIGEVAREIVQLAEDLGAGLIVMGSRGHGGISRALMGSVSESVVRHAHCPDTIVRE